MKIEKGKNKEELKLMNDKGRIRSVDIMRGFAIILMITGHSFIIHPIDIHNIAWCLTLHKWIYSFHMELFFLLAGCVYNCLNYGVYINKKIDRLAVPYLFFGIIVLGLHSLGLDAVNKHVSFIEGLYKLVTSGGSYWFLYVLFELYLIYPLLEKLCKNKWFKMVVAFICVTIYSSVKVTDFLELAKCVYYMPYFILGRYAVNIIRSKKVDNRMLIIVLLMSVISYGILNVYGKDVLIFCIGILRYTLAVLMIISAYVISQILVFFSNKGFKFCRQCELLFTNCGNCSLQLYLFNGFILVFIRTILISILHIYNPFVIVSALVVGNIIISLSICNYVLPKTKWLAWLCGTGKRPF